MASERWLASIGMDQSDEPFIMIDDLFYDDPRIAVLSTAAVGLYVIGLSYSLRHGTSGHLPACMVRKWDGDVAEELVDNGLWTFVEDADEFLIHYADLEARLMVAGY